MTTIDDLSDHDIARLIAEVVKHHGAPMDNEDIRAATDVLIDHHESMLVSQALWRAWHRRWIELGVSDGEMTCWPGEQRPDDD